MTSLNQVSTATQAKDGKQRMYSAEQAKRMYIDDLISDHATQEKDGSWRIYVCDLDFPEKKIFLSHLVDLKAYENLIEYQDILADAIEEFEFKMQRLMDERLQETKIENKYYDYDEVGYEDREASYYFK